MNFPGYDNEILAAYDGSGNVTARYAHGLIIDEHLAVQQGTTASFYHADGLGSIVALTNSSGAVVQTYSYDAFGNITPTGAINQPYSFTGREYDPETGMYFYRARYYDPKAGRFMTKDPIGFTGGDVNLYGYVQNNPMNMNDPSGMHEREYWHIHSNNKTTGTYAMTVPFTGPITYYPSYDKLHPLEQDTVDYHEQLHLKLGPFASEKEVWRREIVHIQDKINQTPFIDKQQRSILESWKRRNENSWNKKYCE